MAGKAKPNLGAELPEMRVATINTSQRDKIGPGVGCFNAMDVIEV